MRISHAIFANECCTKTERPSCCGCSNLGNRHEGARSGHRRPSGVVAARDEPPYAPPLSLAPERFSDGRRHLAPSARAYADAALLSSVSKPSRSFGLSVSGAVSPSAPGQDPVSPARAPTVRSATAVASIARNVDFTSWRADAVPGCNLRCFSRRRERRQGR